MLAEIEDARQIAGEGTRRWFRDDNLDLIVWYDDSSEISGFQLCYDKYDRERAITWKRGDSYQHHAIDDGETQFGSKMTPILIADGVFDKDRIATVFDEQSRNVDPDIVHVVLKKIKAYPAT